MPCYHPLYRVPVRNLNRLPKHYRGRVKHDALITSDPSEADYIAQLLHMTVQQIPCGSCTGCRLEYSKQWATRIMMEVESRKGVDCWFLTLTYDDDHLPEQLGYDVSDDGEIYSIVNLVPEHLTKFWKRLRKAFPDCKISYFAAGEYGDKGLRPHYHACVFGLPLTDLRIIGRNELRQPIFSSAKLEKIWGKGFVSIGELEFESAAYVARYTMKKQKGKEAKARRERFQNFNEVVDGKPIVQPFARMSLKRPIGKQYMLDNMGRFVQNGCTYIRDGKKVLMPRYFLRLVEKTDPDLFPDYQMKRERFISIKIRSQKVRSFVKMSEISANAEKVKREQIRALRRKI